MDVLGKLEKFSDGEIIFREGEYGNKMYIILKGIVKISKRELKGAGYIISIFEVGDFFGEMSVVRGLKRTATAKAFGEVECRTLDLADFKILILHNSNVSMKLIHNLCDRMEESLRKNDELDLELRIQRVLFSLIGIATNNGEQALKIKSFRYTYIVEKISELLHLSEVQIDYILILLSKKNKFDIFEKDSIHYIEISRKILKEYDTEIKKEVF